MKKKAESDLSIAPYAFLLAEYAYDHSILKCDDMASKLPC
jgi:hypothetical protein